jgi:transcriptional regulator with XRE-family HTH domain
MALTKTSCFSERFSLALAQNDMSSTELSKKVGLSKQAISTYATGLRSPKLPTARLIAETLNVDDMWLMGYDVPIERKKPTTSKDDELILGLFKELNEENRQKVLELARLYIGNQDK